MQTDKIVSPLIHSVDPYEGFDHSAMEVDLQGWGAESLLFEQLLKLLRPRLVIEVGSWKGRSAIYMASLAHKHGVSLELVCIDTFLGSWEHWEKGADNAPVAFRNGRPVLYEQFLANVMKHGLEGVITPLPLDSGNAATLLAKLGVQADMIYVDADHEYEGVLADIEAYWPLVRPGGVLLGDDFVQEWPGVIRAVCDFSNRIGVEYATVEEKWYMQKPGE